jgi:ribosome-associated protein
MRDVDVTKIRLVLDEDGQQALKENMRFQRLEKIRERLLEGDQLMLDELIGKIPDLDIQYIRQLVRQAARESSNSKPPASSRKLFSYLKELANI